MDNFLSCVLVELTDRKVEEVKISVKGQLKRRLEENAHLETMTKGFGNKGRKERNKRILHNLKIFSERNGKEMSKESKENSHKQVVINEGF
jgi:hypothetical protein